MSTVRDVILYAIGFGLLGFIVWQVGGWIVGLGWLMYEGAHAWRARHRRR